MDDRDKKVLVIVKEKTKKYLKNWESDAVATTESIAETLKLSRTSASRTLNQLFKKRQIIKINTRPVCFFATNETLQKQLQNEYSSLLEFSNDFKNKKSNFELYKIIGWNRSLQKQVEQIKASLMYPDNGLPVIIFGQSGTGKSFFVRCAHNYAIARGVLKENAPFVTINCAQYADNPELLSSILFGYVKGAFTGAENEKSGAIAKANDGILFLDEVHRLSAEGQEKLFTYMDTGVFSPLGDDAKKIYSSARLMFATTARKSDFLETFLRRVPIRINMPSLEDRSFLEKKQLINSFISAESKRIKKPIEITNKAINILYRHNYLANVGEAKNIIKSIIATAYSNQFNDKTVEISIRSMPASFYADTEKAIINKTLSLDKAKKYFSDNKQDQLPEEETNPIVMKIQQAWKYIEKMDISKIRSRGKYVFIVKNLMNHLYFSVVQADDAIFTHTLTEIRDILKLMQYGEEFYDNNNFVYGISVYVYYVLNADQKKVDHVKVSKELIQLFSKQYVFMQQMQSLLEKEFEVSFSDNDMLWLSMMMSSEELPALPVPAIIMAHGYATASSIADTTNEILHYPVFHAIDMLPAATAEDMVSSLQRTLRRLSPSDGLVILIDMGSLSVITKRVIKFFSYPLLLIDKVSTPVAIEVGNKLQQGKDLLEISKDINQTRNNCTFINAKSKQLNVIVSTCMTGVGTAEQIQKLLVKSFEGIIDVKVITCEFDTLAKGLTDFEKENYNVLGIIGVDDPQVAGIPYLGLEDIISGNKMLELKKMLSPVSSIDDVQAAEQQLIKNFSLSRVMDSLTIISPEKVMPVLEKFLKSIGTGLDKPLSNKKQIALYVHLGSMIERLVRGEGITKYKGNNNLISHDKIFSVLFENISVIEDTFMIKVSDPEMAYIREIIVN